MAYTNNIIRFDWAIKRLLRDKANFNVLEGFLSVLFDDQIKIVSLLESEGNKQNARDKQNRVDVLAENKQKELIIIEVQNESEYDYFHRMLYGVSKAICDYMKTGYDYAKVRKVYSVNIVYFDLGQGEDYIYHGTTSFVGMRKGDILQLSRIQQNFFPGICAGDVYPEYYVLKVNRFDEVALTPLDEWISYLKTGDINRKTKVPGLKEACEQLQFDLLSPKDKAEYNAHLEEERSQRSMLKTAHVDGLLEGREEGREEGRAEEKTKVVRNGYAQGLSIEMLSQIAQLPPDEIQKIITG